MPVKPPPAKVRALPADLPQWKIVSSESDFHYVAVTAHGFDEENAKRIALCWNMHDRLVNALEGLNEMCEYALPKFNWGESFLDAEAITLLNNKQILMTRTLYQLKEMKKALGIP